MSKVLDATYKIIIKPCLFLKLHATKTTTYIKYFLFVKLYYLYPILFCTPALPDNKIWILGIFSLILSPTYTE